MDKKKFLISSFFVLFILFNIFHSGKQIVRRRFLESEAEPDNINIESEEEKPSTYPYTDINFWISLLIASLLILMAAICSGMTVGYLSIDELQLEIYKQQGTAEQQRQATLILPILKEHHMLLCTLLIGNAFCMEALPIFFDKIVPPAFAVLISVLFIVFAGEILPQALCTGPKQLMIAEKLTPLIKVVIFLFYPISYPLARMLDSYFGEHGSTRFQKNELKALIELHGIQKHKAHHDDDDDEPQGFTQAEINMITSTIDLKEKVVSKVMVPISEVFSINQNCLMNKETMTRISSSGYSYVAVYKNEKENITGTIRAKQLIDMEQSGKKLSELSVVKHALFVQSNTSLLEMLMIFKQRKTKIAFIIEPPSQEMQQNMSLRSISNQVIEDRKGLNIVGLISLKGLFSEIVKKEFDDQENHIKLHSIQYNHASPMIKMKEPFETDEKL